MRLYQKYDAVKARDLRIELPWWYEYQFCRICGKRVSDLQFEIAKKNHIMVCCSQECTEKYLRFRATRPLLKFEEELDYEED